MSPSILIRARDIGIQRLVARYCCVLGLKRIPVATRAVNRSCTVTIPNTFRINLQIMIKTSYILHHLRIQERTSRLTVVRHSRLDVDQSTQRDTKRRTQGEAFVRFLLYLGTVQIRHLCRLTLSHPIPENIPKMSTLEPCANCR